MAVVYAFENWKPSNRKYIVVHEDEYGFLQLKPFPTLRKAENYKNQIRQLHDNVKVYECLGNE